MIVFAQWLRLRLDLPPFHAPNIPIQATTLERDEFYEHGFQKCGVWDAKLFLWGRGGAGEKLHPREGILHNRATRRTGLEWFGVCPQPNAVGTSLQPQSHAARMALQSQSTGPTI